MTTYDPEIWLESTTRVLHDYVVDTINAPNVYSVVMQFPGADIDSQKLPLDKTIIHFQVDSIDEKPLGLGDRPVTENYDEDTGETRPQWARVHRINFDVGVWSSDRSGGTTSRMRARQWLTRLFAIPEGAERLRDYSDGGDGILDVLSFSGGRNAEELVNDVRLYRLVDTTLEIRVYSRTPLGDAPVVMAIEEIPQAPNLTILG